MDIGFIGLGIMGHPMALRLVAGGHRVLGYSRSAQPEVLRAEGIVPMPSSSAVAAAAEIVITMLPNTPDVEIVLFGPAGVMEGLGKGKLVIDMSSISPAVTKDFAARIAAAGSDYLDAPVSGGEIGAKNGSLSIMAGGSEEAFAQALPLFSLMGGNIHHVGPVSSGQIAKIANQIIVALSIEAVSEALVFVSRAGVDPDKVRRALQQGFAGSRVLEVHGKRMIERSFEPGFRIELHRKDLGLALDAAQELDLALPNTAATEAMLSACIVAGEGGLDHSALIRAIERFSGAEEKSEGVAPA